VKAFGELTGAVELQASFSILTSSVSNSYTYFTDPDPGFFPYPGSRLLFNTEKKHFFKGNFKRFVGNLFFNQKSRYFIEQGMFL